MDDLTKLIKDSTLSEGLKTAYLKVLPDMTDDEKTELRNIIEEGRIAKAKYNEDRVKKLTLLNEALKKHLQEVSHKEQKYIRQEFEAFDAKEDEQEMKNLEQEINSL